MASSSSSSSSTEKEDLAKDLEALNDSFVTARDEIEMAREDVGTTYFNDQYLQAQECTTEVLAKWQAILSRLDEEEKGKLVRSMGMKIEQLKAEFRDRKSVV